MLQPILTIENLVEGTIIKRPSKHIKTPYVADILMSAPIDEDMREEVLGHTASLGCCGLADTGATILMAPIVSSKPTQCKYKVFLSIVRTKNGTEIDENERIIGIHPKLAEDLTENALKCNLLQKLQNVKRYARETVIYAEGKVDSRFDFTGIDENGCPFIMEVKNVPLADYEDITAKERKGKCYDDIDSNAKVAYFPDGYRKKRTDTVSPRALKHIKELTLIKRCSRTRCIMCYVIQRTDVNRFQISVLDPEYRMAVKEAIESGVEVITMVIQWTREGRAYFVRDDLPMTPIEAINSATKCSGI